MIFQRNFPVYLAVGLMLSACSLLEAGGPAAATGTSEALITHERASETPTIVWFPATETATPLPFATHTPTPEMHPGVGDTLLHDSFTDDEAWDTAVSDKGSASIDRHRLTLAVQPKVYLMSLRHDLVISDFYAEITARLSLCRADDDYGVLMRANAVAYYRFSLSCNGTARAERVSVGTRQVLHESIPSGDVPRGSPGEVRIGVWAAGTEMRLFLNGRYQFAIHNPNYRTGTVGVFARAAGDTPVTVSFYDLIIQEVEYSPPTRTPPPP